MSRKGQVGKCAIYPQSFQNGIMHSDVVRLRCNFKVAHPIFIACQFKLSPMLNNQVKQVSSGAIMAGVNVTKLKNIKIQLPPISIQNQFAQIVKNIEAQKAILKQSIWESDDLFNGLVQKAFMGELAGRV